MPEEEVTLPAADMAPTLTHGVMSPFGVASSRDIGDLAEALALAQAVLVNPEKDKEAKIDSSKANFSYKYVDFGAALAIIRPALAAQNLSFMQLPVIDRADLNVVTRLMHKSGQWIESIYPVAAIGEHRSMGGALTYAKRYALFAMIGISGEDDMDAEPGITGQPAGSVGSGTKAAPPQVRKQTAPQDKVEVKPLDDDASAAAAAAMITALAGCTDREAELSWAKENSAVKASLLPNDAKAVTDAFTAHQRARRATTTKDAA